MNRKEVEERGIQQEQNIDITYTNVSTLLESTASKAMVPWIPSCGRTEEAFENRIASDRLKLTAYRGCIGEIISDRG